MKKILFLFDIDGTLTPSRKTITNEMRSKLIELKNLNDETNYKIVVDIGIVGGSDLAKQQEQMGDSWSLFDYQFPENGLTYYRAGTFVKSTSFIDYLGQDKMNALIDMTLEILSRTKCPEKTGTFIEYRTGMLNICPVGRNCSQEQRMRFFEYDKIHNVRKNIVKELEQRFANDNGIKLSIGGQISIDVFPKGWDKTFCLRYVENNYDDIHFFGDKTEVGGNDYEIYEDVRTIGHTVLSPEDTIQQLDGIIANLKSKF